MAPDDRDHPRTAPACTQGRGLRSSRGINPSVYTALVKKELCDKLKTTTPEFVSLEFNSAEDKQNYTLRISENSYDIIPKEAKPLPPTILLI